MTGLIAHEWVEKIGGSEAVLGELLEMFGDADLAVLWSDRTITPRHHLVETWLANTPLRRHKAAALPFMPLTWRTAVAHLNYDWILTSSHLFAHHISTRNRKQIPKLSYVHTPARYVWEPELDRRGAGTIARTVAAAVKPIDRIRAKESASIAANSEYTRSRINRCWGVDARVIYPPVDTTRISSQSDWSTRLSEQDAALLDALPAEFLLGASRFVSYKRLDAVLEAGARTGMPVVLAGGGPEHAHLRALARELRVEAHFVPRPSDELLYSLYQRCAVFLFLAVEDFGIMPVEAAAAGARVIVSSTGGAAESVALMKAGIAVAVDDADWVSVIAAARQLPRDTVAQASARFSTDRFRHEVRAWTSEYFGSPE